nr:MAG TPA: hypothetical protein [Caudoviricetes sp.]
MQQLFVILRPFFCHAACRGQASEASASVNPVLNPVLNPIISPILYPILITFILVNPPFITITTPRLFLYTPPVYHNNHPPFISIYTPPKKSPKKVLTLNVVHATIRPAKD